MKANLNHFNKHHLNVIRFIGEEADRCGMDAYMVGGIVRDIFLKRQVLDLDIVVDGDAFHIGTLLAKKFKTKIHRYAKFGTATVMINDSKRIDIAIARQERYPFPGSLPLIKKGAMKDDLFRRDFSINAMAIRINKKGSGELVDYYGGMRDLRNRTIRILHEKSFEDDPTRILRAVRFEQRFGFKIERTTLRLLKSALRHKAVRNVKPPRYFAEFKKILSEPEPILNLKRLKELQAWKLIDSHLKINFSTVQSYHTNIVRTRQKFIDREHSWSLVYLIALFQGVSIPIQEKFIARFPLTKEEIKSIRQSQNAACYLKDLSKRDSPPSQVYRLLKPLTHSVVLLLGVMTKNKVVIRRIDRFLNEDTFVRLHINGRELKRYGISAGKKMGDVLEQLLNQKIDRKIRTKREEIKAVQYLVS